MILSNTCWLIAQTNFTYSKYFIIMINSKLLFCTRCTWMIMLKCLKIRYRSENNFVGPSK